MTAMVQRVRIRPPLLAELDKAERIIEELRARRARKEQTADETIRAFRRCAEATSSSDLREYLAEAEEQIRGKLGTSGAVAVASEGLRVLAAIRKRAAHSALGR